MAHFLQTRTEPRLVSRPSCTCVHAVWFPVHPIALTPRQYYKPWETTAEEDDRIREQIADARDTIHREQKDFEAAQRRYAEREREAASDVHMSDAHTRSGKEYNAETPPKPAAANGPPTNGSETSKTLDQDDTRAHTRADGLATLEQDSTAAHERLTDETGKEAIDDHGEEVVEAAEDTVMY